MAKDKTETLDVLEANRRHDAQHGNPHQWARIRTTWRDGVVLRGERLTDGKIAKYERAGWYKPELKIARRDLAKMRAEKQAKRDVNFDVDRDGRMIYRP